MPKKYWLFKSEPDVFSWDDLVKAKKRTTTWEGIRNYQARNLLRDECKRGDQVFFYHSRINPPAIMGIAEVVKEAYPDPEQFDPKSKYYDASADPEDPRWLMVDVKAVKAFRKPIDLPTLKEHESLEGLMVIKRGARLSIQPVEPAHWKLISRMGQPKKLD